MGMQPPGHFPARLDRLCVFLRFYKLCKMLQTETVTHTDLRTEILVNFRNQLTFHCLLLEDTVEPRIAMGNS